MSKSDNGRHGKKPNGSGIRYLPAQVEPGMFRGEFLAYLRGYTLERPDEPVKVQMLVDEKEVEGVEGTPKRNKPANAWVRVTLVGEDRGLSRVVLPQPAQPVGESMLVDATALREKTPR